MASESRNGHQLSMPFDQKTALAAQEEFAKKCNVSLRTANSLSMEFILIPPGEFTCGGSDDLNKELRRQGLSTIEEPTFQCILTTPIYVGIYRVTQDQYRSLMGVNPSYYADTGDLATHVKGLDTSRFPVEGVSWYDCIEACNSLSEREGLPDYYRFSGQVFRNSNGAIHEADVAIVGGSGYRLLTSAEWEWVARAGTTTVYFYGNERSRPAWRMDIGRPWPVGAEPANNFGVYDLYMYAEEWTFDAYSYDNDVKGPLIDPVHLTNSDSERVARGHDSFSRIMEVAGAAEYRNFRFCRSIEVKS